MCQAGVGDGCGKEQERPVVLSLGTRKTLFGEAMGCALALCETSLFCWNNLSFACSETSSSHECGDL